MARRPSDDDSAEWVGRLYDRFAGPLYRYAVMVLADRNAASDVVHQVFVSLLQYRPGDVEDDERFLRRAVRNECFTALRKRTRETVSIGDSPLLERVAPGDDPATRLAIEEGLCLLPPEQREVLQLKVYEGMTFQEIADLTGEGLNTITSRYRYAIEKLRAQLGARK